MAGCGSGDDGDSTAAAPPERTQPPVLSKEEMITQSNAVCAEVNAAIGAIGSTSSGATAQASQVVSLYSGMAERLRNLGTPREDEVTHAEFIVAVENLVRAEEKVKLASEREDGEALSGEEAAASSALSEVRSAASAFGLEECAEAPAAPAPSSSSAAEPSSEESAAAVEEEVEEVAPEEAEVAPEAGGGEEESAGGGAGVGGGTEGGSAGSGGDSSGGIGPG